MFKCLHPQLIEKFGKTVSLEDLYSLWNTKDDTLLKEYTETFLNLLYIEYVTTNGNKDNKGEKSKRI